MTGVGDLLAFSAIMAVGQFSPGPDMILLTRTALRTGTRAGVKTAWGIACGLMVHATVAIAGLALAIERLPVLRESLRWLAVVYLLWLAFSIFKEFSAGFLSDAKITEGATLPRGRPFTRGLLCNLLNPKAALFLAAVSAPFLRGDHPTYWPVLIWLIIVLQSGVLWSLWVVLLQWKPLRLRYELATKWLDAVFAVGLAALAIRLMVG
jgi:threonine efflux protein